MTASAPDLVAILVSHGDRGGESPNAVLAAQAERVRELTGLTVLTGMLKGEPALAEAVSQAAATGASRIVVYPLFMADGYFVKKVRECASAVTGATAPVVLAPLGIDPALADILVDEAVNLAQRENIETSGARLLIVGHGSKLGPASASATRKVAARAALARRFASVTTAFLEEEPFLEDALRASKAPTIVAGFFFGGGMHAAEDVPEAIAETGANAVYTGAIGDSPAIARLIAAALTTASKQS